MGKLEMGKSFKSYANPSPLRKSKNICNINLLDKILSEISIEKITMHIEYGIHSYSNSSKYFE